MQILILGWGLGLFISYKHPSITTLLLHVVRNYKTLANTEKYQADASAVLYTFKALVCKLFFNHYKDPMLSL
jgi:hypothetical protein